MMRPDITQENSELFLKGSIHFENVMQWLAGVESCLSRKVHSEIKINFSGITEVDSSVLSLMMCWLRLCQSLGIKLTYLEVPSHILRVSELYGIRDFLPVKQTS